MKKMINVAVLLTTYNCEKFIREPLFSILSQENVQITIFISDDKSTDSTLEIIKSEYNKDKIKLLFNHIYICNDSYSKNPFFVNYTIETFDDVNNKIITKLYKN